MRQWRESPESTDRRELTIPIDTMIRDRDRLMKNIVRKSVFLLQSFGVIGIQIRFLNEADSIKLLHATSVINHAMVGQG